VLLSGYLDMVSRLSGDQWNEGDVSCSVVRRVALPSAMYTLDGALESFLTVLDEMEVFEATIATEVRRTMPFLATTTLMMEGVKRGGGRETLHTVIKNHSVEVARAMRNGTLVQNDLAQRLGEDAEFPLSTKEIEALLSDMPRYRGAAVRQAEAFVGQVATVSQTHPEAAVYKPEPIL